MFFQKFQKGEFVYDFLWSLIFRSFIGNSLTFIMCRFQKKLTVTKIFNIGYQSLITNVNKNHLYKDVPCLQFTNEDQKFIEYS